MTDSQPNIDDDTKDRVVALYQAGTKTAEITALTGVGRSSIYFVLEQRGVKRVRRSQPSQPTLRDTQERNTQERRALPPQELLDRLGDAERRRGQLEQVIDQMRRLLSSLD